MSEQIAGLDKESILKRMVGILEEMTSDWDTDLESPMSADTKLVSELGFESIDVVQLIVEIEESFKCRDLPFEDLLMADGRYVDELAIGNAVDFLHSHLGAEARAAS